MRTLLTLLLIPSILMCQGLGHAHSRSGFLQPHEHAGRPHIHLRGGLAHRHHHSGRGGAHSHKHGKNAHYRSVVTGTTESAADGPRAAHDDDAVYFSVIAAVASSPSSALVVKDRSPIPVFTTSQADDGVDFTRRLPVHPPPRLGNCPIYLRNLSLRI